MNLPNPIAALVQAQNNFDHNAYADCFTNDAVVHDEGEDHIGRAEIREWIRKANEKYQSQMIPRNILQDGSRVILEAEVSGTFPGSPIVLNFNMELAGDYIKSLKVTG